MKKVELVAVEGAAGFGSKEILIAMLSGPAEPVSFDEGLRRARVLRKLNASACPGDLLLEDEEFRTLEVAIRSAKIQLVNVDWFDAVTLALAAEAVEVTVKPLGEPA